MLLRKAEKAGTWYAGDAVGLAREVETALLQADVHLQKLPGNGRCHGNPIAAVVPHAGLAYSGGIAASAFALLRNALERVDAFLVFGACHRQLLTCPAIWTEGDWDTPLGPIQVDRELIALLLKTGIGESNATAHTGDNAIELETPFIKALFPEASMAPVAMGFLPDSRRIGRRTAEAIMADPAYAGKTVVALASTDLTHYGASFGVMPAGRGETALAWARQNDRRFLDRLVGLDACDIVALAERDGSACGAGAAAAVMGWAEALGCRQGRLLAHATSHDVDPAGEAEHFVGYGAALFEMEA